MQGARVTVRRREVVCELKRGLEPCIGKGIGQSSNPALWHRGVRSGLQLSDGPSVRLSGVDAKALRQEQLHFDARARPPTDVRCCVVETSVRSNHVAM